MRLAAVRGIVPQANSAQAELSHRSHRRWLRFGMSRRRAAAVPPQRHAGAPDTLEPTIYRFIFRHSLPQQLLLLLLTFFSFPFLYYSLELPKTITNKAIKPHYTPQTVLGHPLGQIPYLMVLCFAFLLLVLINGAFKYYINTYKGRLGERMLRRFRYQLFQRMLQFPPYYFHKNSSAQIIPMITAECESLGGFIGDAMALPAFQGGTLLTNIIFMFMQDPVLGTAAVALYPIQGYVIPKLQRKVNQLNRLRVRTIRQVADRVHESASGITDILANDSTKLQLAQFAHLLGTIYDIRFEIYQRKFLVKFLNNFIGQLTPFFFFSIGGYLVIHGELSIGGLLPVLIAYKGLASPWKELLDFYQSFQDSRIKYEQIVEQFAPLGMVYFQVQAGERAEAVRLGGELVVTNLSYAEDDRSRVLDGVSVTVPLDRQIAVIGQGGCGKGELALLLARLIQPTAGRIRIGGFDLADLPQATIGRQIGYVGASPHMFAGTLRDNLLVGLRHAPMRAVPYDPQAAKRRSRQAAEAARAGNLDLDVHADWIDYESAGVTDRRELSRRISELLSRLGCESDVYALGLRWRLDPEADPETAQRLLAARKALARRMSEDGSAIWSKPTTPPASIAMLQSRKICCSVLRSGRCSISRRLPTIITCCRC